MGLTLSYTVGLRQNKEFVGDFDIVMATLRGAQSVHLSWKQDQTSLSLPQPLPSLVSVHRPLSSEHLRGEVSATMGLLMLMKHMPPLQLWSPQTLMDYLGMLTAISRATQEKIRVHNMDVKALVSMDAKQRGELAV